MSTSPGKRRRLTSSKEKNDNEERYMVLIEFAYKHLDFQMAELDSILDMHGITLGGPDCVIHPLPGEDRWNRSRRPYTILSFPSKEATRLSTKSLEDTSNLKLKSSSLGIAEILSDCTLVRSVTELWGFASTINECVASTKAWKTKSKIGKKTFGFTSKEDQSWKLTVRTLGLKYNREEQATMRSKFSDLGFLGPVKMEEPDNEYILIKELEMDGKASVLYPRYDVHKNFIPENDARPPLAVYFGRVLGGPGKNKGRMFSLEQYNLKHRVYLGPTSMDAELSFVMASLGQIRKGSVCFDPFVGTGSILLSCALRGAYCIGSDIDIRVLKGRNDRETIYSNFDQFKLRRPELMRTDNAIYHRHFRSHTPLYDAIICDPPYGIRAGARKTGSRLNNPRPILDKYREDHIAQTKPYPVCDVMSDLLDVAARTLVMNGRLVYVIPSFVDFDPKTDLPRHDCLELVHSCYQPLQAELGRRIVAMKKVRDYDDSLRESYLSNIWVNGKESAEKCANLRDKIIEAAKKKPGYEEKAAFRKEKRKANREAKKRAKAKKVE